MIFQELAAAPDLTVAENVMLGQWPVRRGFVSWRALRATARRILDELGVDLDLDAPVSKLRVAERQVIEIARALLGDARCLILDEPTAALSHQEVERLFAFVHRLRDRGVAIVYITHRLDEVSRDRRQRARAARRRVGARRARARVSNAPSSSRPWSDARSAASSVPHPRGASRPPRCSGSSPQGPARRSRISTSQSGTARCVALYGKIGSGTAEVGEAAFGVRKLEQWDGSSSRHRGSQAGRPCTAIRAGVGFLPGRPATRRRVHGPLGRGEPVRAVVAPPRARLAVSVAPGSRRMRTGAGTTCSASARATIRTSRSRRSRAATSRRSCSDDGSRAGSRRSRSWSSRRAVSTSGPGRRSTARSGSSPPTESVSSSSRPTTRRSCRSRTAPS